MTYHTNGCDAEISTTLHSPTSAVGCSVSLRRANNDFSKRRNVLIASFLSGPPNVPFSCEQVSNANLLVSCNGWFGRRAQGLVISCMVGYN